MTHSSHEGRHAVAVDPEILDRTLTRLRRIEGQVRGLQKMVADERYRADVLTQIASVHEALRAVGRKLMRNHLRHCATTAIRAGENEAEEMYDELLELMYRHVRYMIRLLCGVRLRFLRRLVDAGSAILVLHLSMLGALGGCAMARPSLSSAATVVTHDHPPHHHNGNRGGDPATSPASVAGPQYAPQDSRSAPSDHAPCGSTAACSVAHRAEPLSPGELRPRFGVRVAFEAATPLSVDLSSALPPPRA